MVVDPLQRCVGEHEIEPLVEPVAMSPCTKERPATSPYADWARASMAGEESMPTVSLGLHLLVQDLGQIARPAPEIDDAPAGHGMAQHQQIVEGLLALRTEPLVLVGAPPVDRSHSHRAHV